jgi:hypothetical protein
LKANKGQLRRRDVAGSMNNEEKNKENGEESRVNEK